MRESEFEFIRQFVYERSRISLGANKRELVAARLGKRLREARVASFSAYCRLLEAPEGEAETRHLIDVVSTHHTAFFRENQHFELIGEQIVPEMLARFRAERWPRFRAWSAACSSGEEPYSLAIVLAEALEQKGWGWHIDATDISERVLEIGRTGVYRAEAVASVPPLRRRRHFQRGIGRETGNFRAQAALRSAITFHTHHLLGGPTPFTGSFHLILCRNVMIYFDHATQEELVNRLAQRLVPGGYLLVGHAESLTSIRHGLEMFKPAVYRRPLAA
jgi:chemotaxis protein methyltransferase CheR